MGGNWARRTRSSMNGSQVRPAGILIRPFAALASWPNCHRSVAQIPAIEGVLAPGVPTSLHQEKTKGRVLPGRGEMPSCADQASHRFFLVFLPSGKPSFFHGPTEKASRSGEPGRFHLAGRLLAILLRLLHWGRCSVEDHVRGRAGSPRCVASGPRARADCARQHPRSGR